MNLKSYFLFSKSQRIGILTLLLLIIAVQGILYYINFREVPNTSEGSRQSISIKSEIDSLKKEKAKPPKLYPFNPNYITDFKGYSLGMSVQEIDRLLAFRKHNQFVNSADEFQAVTKISDSLLGVIAPYFKFPDWVNKRKAYGISKRTPVRAENFKVIDINAATAEDLIRIYGIGPALSERILKLKEILGGFASIDQMEDVWGLSPEVIASLKKSFAVTTAPNIKKVHINTATLKELSQFPYFRYPLSKSIVTYRSMHGNIGSAADLAKIPNFPVEKIERIAVYLEF